MTKQKSEISERVIKLTRDDLMSEHVDELLQRQMNLRGERAIIGRKRRWYYQNWFIFMVVGCIAAIIAWAVIEPYFDDTHPIQGKLEKIDNVLQNDSNRFIAHIHIGEADILINEKTEILSSSGDGDKVSLEKLKQKLNQVIDVYVSYRKQYYNNKDHFYAPYLSYSGVSDVSQKASMSLNQWASRNLIASLLMFSLIASFMGLAIGAVDGVISRTPRRALIGGGVGFIIGFIGGFLSSLLGEIIYGVLHSLAQSAGRYSTLGFLIQIIARALAWGAASMIAGLGYGISLRSKRLVLYGFLGGILGGILGGLFFDPIAILLRNPLNANLSRFIGFALIGASVGAAIGIVERLSRDAWLRMTEGPLAGKEFLIFKDVMKLGSSPRNEIYLFKDNQIKEVHARLLSIGGEYEIESQDILRPVLVNNRPVKSLRLNNGDRISIGKTSFIFEKREK